tara:strand:- start:1426 stop:2157 length:732 start_codon:yes stop_codon:yes gene_type:complete
MSNTITDEYFNPNNIEVKYFGEMGYFCYLLGYLEKFLEKTNIVLYIYTYENYWIILNILFKNRIYLKKIENLVSNRGYFYCPDLDNKYNNILNLKDFIKLKTNIYDIQEYQYIKNYCKVNLININFTKKIVLFYLRNKQHGSGGRDFKDDPTHFIENIMTKYNSNEYIPVQYGIETKTSSKYSIISDFKDLIYILNNCECLISSDSGFIDLAKICNTREIYIIDRSCDYHLVFNPFNCKIKNI